MSFDLYEQENLEAVSNLPPVQDVEPSFFAGMSQVPKLAMRSLAVAGRAGSMAAASVPVLMDRLTGDTTLEDKYFKFHEDTFQSAVDYWTPRPNEVGTAAQVVGDLVTTLPMAIAAPPIALGSAYLGASEDLVRQGVDPLKAQAVGATQAAGFALGIWMPILGKNLWQRTVVGGAGFNVLQGAVTRGVSGEMLEGTPAEGQFKAFDGEAMTLDVLMGLGFGTFAHLSPSQRAQGEEAWNKISEWAQNMTPSQKAAVATLREAQHMNVDSTPGKPIDPSDIEAHVNRMRTAIDQIVNDQPVDVENILVPGRTKDEPDDPLKALSDTTLQAVGDLGPGREITRGVGVTDADWALLEKEGLVQEGTTEDGEKYHYVSTDALVGERERRYQAEVQARKNRTIDPEEQAAAVERRAANYERVAAEKTEAGYPDEADQLTAKAKELRAQAKAIRENALPHEPQFQPDPVREQENVERTRQMLDIAEQVRHDEGLPEVSQVGRTITERLMELGTPAQEAADKGLLWDTFFKSMESRTGQDAGQLFGKYFDRIFNAGEALPDDAVMQGGKEPGPIFYSQLNKSIEDAPAKVFGTGKQLKEWITANAGKLGVKKDEIEATGLNEWLDLQQGKVSKEQVQDFLKNNGVQVQEVMLGKDGAARRISELQRQYPDDVLRAASNGENKGMAESDYKDWQDATQAIRETQPAKFSDPRYQLPGGENYRELLLTLPAKRYWNDGSEVTAEDISTPFGRENADRVAHYGDDVFNSSHFPDQPNILAHVRFNERTDADGKRVLFLEEIQSDWAQKGRKEGFKKESKYRYEVFDSKTGDIVGGYDNEDAALRATQVRGDDGLYHLDYRRTDSNAEPGNAVPSAPFVTDTKAWAALALKRMIRYAAENGFDRIAWTNGEQQAARYDLSKHIEEVTATPVDGGYHLTVIDKSGNKVTDRRYDTKALPDVVGKELADKIVKNEGEELVDLAGNNPEYVYRGLDLKVGGEGMRGFYDQIVPQVANDVLKKLGGGKVGTVEMMGQNAIEQRAFPNRKYEPDMVQPGFDITPALREKVMAGMPLFQKTVDGARGFLEFGQNGKMGIGLLASADKSTFLHESGHFFLEVMNDLSNEANAPPELRADMQAIHEWMGVSREQWASMSLEQKRPFHEQWTRGFEQYLMEGKAPTSRLKEAFARFRDWLIEIYKSATALNVTLSDDVRKVMDNMLTVKESEPRQSPTGDGVPPPRASIGEDSAGNSDLDKALTSGEPLLDKIRPLDDPDLVATLQDMAANEAGWAEKGGNLMREFGDEGEVTGRTQWIPKAEWWPDRPGAGKANRKLNEAQVAEAVRKHLAGEPLKSLELQTVEYMSKIANDRLNSVEMIGDQEFGNTMQDIAAESIEPTTEKVFDSQAIGRARQLNPEAAMQAIERYDVHDDDAIFMAEIRSIIDEAGQQSLENAQDLGQDTGKEADPIQSEAERIVAEDPERRIPIGTGPDGEAVTLTAREYLDQARAQADQARQDVNLIKAAAECLLGQI